jgi:glycosyltransferase involved in cell wall biosynthesis
MPVYNGAAFVGEAIESVLRQTVSDFELIIVDDASTDDSREVIGRYDDPRIRKFRNETNRGLVGNWNECLKRARGTYITMLHQDDVMEPTNLERKLAVLESGERRWVASDCLQIDAQGAVKHEHWFRHPIAMRVADKPRERQFASLFFGSNYLCFPTILWHREVTDTLGGFEEKGGYCVDAYMWLKFLARYAVAYIDDRLIRYRWAQNESLKYQDIDWFYDNFVSRREAARTLSLSSYQVAVLKGLYAPGFLARYAACRLNGDARGAQLMRRGWVALFA